MRHVLHGQGRSIVIRALALAVLLGALVVPGRAGTDARPGAQRDLGRVTLASTSATEDGYYCRYSRGMSGAFYYQDRGLSYVWVPVGELHTAANVYGQFAYGTKLTTSLAGGVTINGGKSWSISASSSGSSSYQVTTTMGQVGGNSHKKVEAQFKYQKVQVVCYNKDPRSGQIVSRDYSPKYRYLPRSWTTNMRYTTASASVPRCRTGRASVPENKVYLPHGQKKSFSWGKAYTTSVSMSVIGISGTFSSSDETSKSVTFWTSSGSSYVCGNTTALSSATKLYANSL